MENRIINLEIKYAHLDEFVQELNKVVVEQSSIIQRLEKEILDLKKATQESGRAVDPARSLADDKPPHY